MTALTPLYDVLYQEPGPKTRRKIKIFTWLSILVLICVVVYILYRFYIAGQLDPQYWFFFAKFTTWKFIFQGLTGTLYISLVAGVVGAIFGFLLMLGKLSKHIFVRALATVIINLTRGIPTLLFIYFFFLVLPLWGIPLPPLINISLPIAISASGVIAEMLRSGVNAVSKGQREAALSLGMSHRRTFYWIILPQALRYVVPALISELVIVVKDSAFAYIVSFPDLMQNSKVLISNYDSLLAIYLLVAVIYIVINYVLNRLSVLVSQRKKKVL